MLLLGQREIKQHTLVMKWRNAKIIHLFIIVYPLRRFEKKILTPLAFFHSKNHCIFLLKVNYFFLGLSSWLGCRKSSLGRYLFRPSSWGEIISQNLFFLPLFLSSTFIHSFNLFFCLIHIGGDNPGLSIDHRALLQSTKFTRSLWSAGLRRVRI